MDLKKLTDPTTNAGTARWAALGIAIYDAARHGLNLANGGVLLTLAGVEVAARIFRSGASEPPEGGQA